MRFLGFLPMDSGETGLTSDDRRPHHCRQPQWTKEHKRLVLRVRDRHRYWGKLKICRVLAREFNVRLSESTVGRIISKALYLKWIKPCCFYRDRVKRIGTHSFPTHGGYPAYLIDRLFTSMVDQAIHFCRPTPLHKEPDSPPKIGPRTMC